MPLCQHLLHCDQSFCEFYKKDQYFSHLFLQPCQNNQHDPILFQDCYSCFIDFLSCFWNSCLVWTGKPYLWDDIHEKPLFLVCTKCSDFIFDRKLKKILSLLSDSNDVLILFYNTNQNLDVIPRLFKMSKLTRIFVERLGGWVVN